MALDAAWTNNAPEETAYSVSPYPHGAPSQGSTDPERDRRIAEQRAAEEERRRRMNDPTAFFEHIRRL
jgi:hypothetical protein